MAVSRNLDILDLPSILQNLADSNRTGTLKITSGKQERFIHFEDGLIRMVYLPEEPDFLADALFRTKAATRAAIERVRQAKGEDDSLADAVVESGVVEEEEVAQAYSYHVQESLCAIVAMEDVNCEFIPGDPPEAFEQIPELDYAANVHPGGLLLEAARRVDMMALVRKTIPSRHDVPMKNREAPEADEDEATILKLVNGIRDVQDIVDEAPMGRFDAESTIKDLIEEDILRLKEWSELVSTAKYVKEHGGGLGGPDEKIDKITRLYERAESLGFTSPQVRLWLARAYERCDRADDACARYAELGDEFLEQDRPKDAVAVLRQATKLAPWDLDIRRKLVEALIAKDERDQAAVAAGGLIMKLQSSGDLEKALEFAREMEEDLPKHEAVLKPLAEINLELGDRIQALIELEDLAGVYVEAQKYPQAVETYHEILDIDDENIDAHYQLASTYKAMGEIDKASRRYKDLADMLSASALEDSINWAFLIDIYENIAALEPHNVTARDWLASAYIGQNDKEKALEHLRGIRDTLIEGDRNLPALVSALERIVELVPSDLEARHELATSLARAEREEESIEAYLALADLALSQDEVETAWSAYAEALNVSPYHLGVHRGLADFHRRQDRPKAAAGKLRDIGYLQKAARKYEKARESFDEAIQLDPTSFACLRELAEACVHADKNDLALDLLGDYAGRCLSRNNLGEAKAAAELARPIDAHASWLADVDAATGKGSKAKT